MNLKLRSRLESLARFYGAKYLDTDPLQFAHRYSKPQDQEIVAFVAALLAYGNVPQILKSVQAVLSQTGKSPRKFVENFDPRRDGRKFKNFSHRFNNGRDIACLFFFLRQVLESHGSLESFFLHGCPQDGSPEKMRRAIDSFVARLEELDFKPFYGKELPALGQGIRFLLPAPHHGSACKRICLFLRWMVRHDEIDLGIWKGISPAELIIPLDTHLARISHRLKFCPSPYASWKNAEEVTRRLREFDAQDPLRFDFPLSRIGIVERWPRREPKTLAARKVLMSLQRSP